MNPGFDRGFMSDSFQKRHAAKKAYLLDRGSPTGAKSPAGAQKKVIAMMTFFY
jgi:hypothetical protein